MVFHSNISLQYTPISLLMVRYFVILYRTRVPCSVFFFLVESEKLIVNLCSDISRKEKNMTMTNLACKCRRKKEKHREITEKQPLYNIAIDIIFQCLFESFWCVCTKMPLSPKRIDFYINYEGTYVVLFFYSEKGYFGLF